VLRLVCSCLKNAPASDTWDLSSLLVDGSPVSSETVTAVLSVIYSSMGALDFEPPPAAGQYSLAQLLEMLLFADAIGCSRGVLNDLAELLNSGYARPQLEITLQDEVEPIAAAASSGITVAAEAAAADLLVLPVRLHKVYCMGEGLNPTEEYYGELYEQSGERLIHLLPGFYFCQQQKEQLDVQLQQQLDALLFVAFKLDLQQLLQPVLRFLRNNAEHLLCSNLTGARPEAAFTPRVLASLGNASNSSSVALAVRGFLQQPLELGWSCFGRSMFSDVVYDAVLPGAKQDSISFQGTLTRDVLGFKTGTRMHVMLRQGAGRMRVSGARETWGGTTHFHYDVVMGPRHTFHGS
jgi:hypothetical protein